jgi:hypothetical protein
MFMVPIDHAHQLQLATANPKKIENSSFKFTFLRCFPLVPNIRYQLNNPQHFLAEYSFSAETRKSVFGRSLVGREQKVCQTEGDLTCQLKSHFAAPLPLFYISVGREIEKAPNDCICLPSLSNIPICRTN